jgi:hypothetical protein
MLPVSLHCMTLTTVCTVLSPLLLLVQQLHCKHWEHPAQQHLQDILHWVASTLPRHPLSCSTRA